MRVAFKNFTGGEVSPSLCARYDLNKFASSAKQMENMFPSLHGDVMRRPGTRFVADLGEYSVIIPFSFSVEADQNYIIVLQDQGILIATSTMLEQARIPSPYRAGELLEISYCQSGDILFMAHPNHPLQRLVRRGNRTDGYYWAVEEVYLNTTLPAPLAPTVTFQRNNGNDSALLGYTLRYKIVAVDQNGNLSLPSEAGTCDGKHPSDWVVGNRVLISWNAVPGATQYNIYREESGYFGFIGVAGVSGDAGSVTGIKIGENTYNVDSTTTQGVQTRTINQGIDEPRYECTSDWHNLHWVHNSDSTSGVSYVQDDTTPSFTVDGNLIFCVRKTTTTRWWQNGWADIGFGTSVRCARVYRTTSYTEYYWLMKTPGGEIVSGNLGNSPSAPNGDIGNYHVMPVYSGASTLSFLDVNYKADISDTPPEDWEPFADGNNPATVSIHQQRLVLGGTAKEPNSFYISRAGDYTNFRKSRPLQEDDPVEYMLASGSIDAIAWTASFGDLLIGTAGAEYKATASDGIITAKNARVSSQSFWGSDKLHPLVIGNAVLHSQRHGGRVRDMYYSLEKDGYAGNDLSILAPHLFDGHSIKQWTYQQTPQSNVWCVRDDGVLLCLTYLKEHDIYAWSRHTTKGKFISACTISGQDSDILALVVKRTIGGADKYFLEMLETPFDETSDIKDAFYVDAGVKQVVDETITDLADVSLPHLEGEKVDILANGSPILGQTVTDGLVTLPYEGITTTIAGLPYTSTLETMPVEADVQGGGSTLGKARAYGRSVVRFAQSVGGRYGAFGDEMYDFPYLPEKWGQPCVPFTGDFEIVVPSAQRSDTTFLLQQNMPLPFHVVAVSLDVVFGEE